MLNKDEIEQLIAQSPSTLGESFTAIGGAVGALLEVLIEAGLTTHEDFATRKARYIAWIEQAVKERDAFMKQEKRK